MEFIFVPGGEYEQGCGHWTSDCDDDETPVRKVHLSPFWIGKTEVTQGQWSRVMGSNPSSQKTGDDYPVETVSWNDVDDFISRLNSRTSEGKFRLPSEAEWEYACRAGGKPIKYAWGNEEPGSASKTGNLYGDSDGHARSAPVGSFAANGIGLFDMTGNVWEWAQDLYRDTAYVDGPTSDPIYAGSGEYRVFRGGGWFSDPRFARCSYRGSGVPTYRADGLGFRLARTKGG
jgi:formylglycine-generating enzyme required for sulfatase activity